MSSKREITDEAKGLMNTDPDKSLELYLKVWDTYKDSFNDWDALFTFKAARASKVNQHNKLIDIAEQFKDDEKASGVFAWYLYDKFIKNKNKTELIVAEDEVRRMTNLCCQKDLFSDDSYPCPLTISVFNLVDAYSEGIFNAVKINEFLKMLNPSFLSRKVRKFNTEKRGEIEVASDLEKYYAYLTKALLKSGNFTQCLTACNTALEGLDTFHYNNDLWFKMRIAISYEKTGEFTKSETLFKELLESKAGGDKWFLYRDIAELYFEQKEYKKAWKFAIDATFYGNEPHFLINLYLLQAKILFKLERVSEGKVLAILIAAILKEQGWNNKAEYTRLFKFFEIDLESVQPVKTCYRNAEKFWLENKYGDIPLTEGEVVFVHNNDALGKLKSLIIAPLTLRKGMLSQGLET
jgi:tetratricopeptide (TPR) repeat protein